MSIPFALPERAVVRGVSARYVDCLRSDASARIDLVRARAQHAAYVAMLRALGITVEEVPTDDDAPDACFIEDTAVVTGAHVLVTCPGAPSRRREVGPVEDALTRRLVVHRMGVPATLDGGDVLRIGTRLFVGVSSRTNAEGVEALRRVASLDGLEVVVMNVRGGLHLKSACTLADADLLLVDPRVVQAEELAAFHAASVEVVAVDEPEGANVLAVGETVIVSAAAPRAAAMLRTRGKDVRVVEVGELHKGDGALTCLSLRVPQAGAWST